MPAFMERSCKRSKKVKPSKPPTFSGKKHPLLTPSSHSAKLSKSIAPLMAAGKKRRAYQA
eukprot:6166941-Ditylum_brightwellii.AAC.1